MGALLSAMALRPTPSAAPSGVGPSAPASPRVQPLNVGLAGMEARSRFQERLGAGAPLPYAVQALYGSALPLIPFPAASSLPGRAQGLLVLGSSAYQASAAPTPPGGDPGGPGSPSPSLDQYA